MKKLIWAQFVILLGGTIFAWTNLGIEINDWLAHRSCSIGCSAYGNVVNPFLTPCFYGAMFFLIAFILNVCAIRSVKREQSKDKIV